MKRRFNFMFIGLVGIATMTVSFTSIASETNEVPTPSSFVAPADLTPLNSLAEFDITATEVQFKNVKTGRFINYQVNPRGGGVLVTGPNKEATPWYFYQAANAEKNNVEIKRTGLEVFNVSPYDMRTDAESFIAYNNGKRHPNNTTPDAPHAFYIEEVSAGIFNLKWGLNGEMVEDVDLPTFIAEGGTGSKAIVRPADANNKAQQWQILVNKKKETETIVSCEGQEFKVSEDKKIWQKIDGNWTHVGDRCNDLVCSRRRVFCYSTDGSLWRYNGTPNSWTPANTLLAGQNLNAGTVMGQANNLVSTNGKNFLYMQENGDIGIWAHDPGAKNIWSSQTAPQTNCTLYMQEDGNLVAYNAANTPIWASDTHVSKDPRYGEKQYKPVRLVLEDDGRMVLYSETGFKVWDNVHKKYELK